MKIKIHLSRIIPTIILSIAFITKWKTYNVIWYFPYLLTIPLLAYYSIYYFSNWNKEAHENIQIIIRISLIPYFICIIYSIFLLVGSDTIINPLFRAISLTGQYAFVILLMGFIYIRFDIDLADILINAMILTYIYILIAALFGLGAKGFLKYITSFWYPEKYIFTLSRWFEIHDMGLSVGMLVIYNLFLRQEKKKVQTALLIIAMVLCYKRIAILAFFVASALALIAKNSEGLIKNKIIDIVLVSMPIVCLLYITIVSTGILYTIGDLYGIDFSGRSFIYIYMKRFYEFSPTFFGKGMGFTEKYLTSINGTAEGAYVNNYGYIHNDVLKMFIDYGFWGCIFWLLWYFIYISSTMKRCFGEYARYVYCIMMVYAFIVYMTDNATRYFVFQAVLFAMLLVSCKGSSKKNEILDYYN